MAQSSVTTQSSAFSSVGWTTRALQYVGYDAIELSILICYQVFSLAIYVLSKFPSSSAVFCDVAPDGPEVSLLSIFLSTIFAACQEFMCWFMVIVIVPKICGIVEEFPNLCLLLLMHF